MKNLIYHPYVQEVGHTHFVRPQIWVNQAILNFNTRILWLNPGRPSTLFWQFSFFTTFFKQDAFTFNKECVWSFHDTNCHCQQYDDRSWCCLKA